jgi:hypothetical protein
MLYGVTATGNRWGARIRYDGKQHYLGALDTKEEAVLAYGRKARQCGPIAWQRRLQNGDRGRGAAAQAAHKAPQRQPPGAATKGYFRNEDKT